MSTPPGWPPDDIRRIVDALADGLLIADTGGTILYANPSAADLLGWGHDELNGQSISLLADSTYPEWPNLFGAFVGDDPDGPMGNPFEVSLRRGNGTTVRVELVLSTGLGRDGRQLVIGVLRPSGGRSLERLSKFTQQLLDVLTAASSASPAEQLLGELGRQLNWDVAALWGVEPDGSLLCRGIWTTPSAPAMALVTEKKRFPTRDAGGLARLVMDRGEPVWFTDLSSNERFTSAAIKEDRLTSACAFPINYGNQCVGAVKMMSRAERVPEPDQIELVGAVSGHLGEILHALEQNSERERLVAELETTKQSLEFLLRVNRAVADAGSYVEAMERLAEMALPRLGDLCLIDVTEGGQIRRMVSRHADPSKQGLAQELHNYPPDPDGRHPTIEVMVTGESMWAEEMSDEFLRSTSQDDHHYEILKQLCFTSYMTVPLLVDGQCRGTVTLVSAGSGRRYTANDLRAAEDLAGQIVGVLERARLFDREHQISHTLQRSLLPDQLPSVRGWDIDARYVPADADVDVGGDWYDAVALDDGVVAFVVGDVSGHDMVAASVMGRLSHMLAFAISEGDSAAGALERVNAYLCASSISRIATVLIVQVDTRRKLVVMCSAGHLAPAVIGADGVRLLELTPNPPLGVPETHYEETQIPLSDHTFLLYSDGLIERRGRSLDDGLCILLEALESSDPDSSAGLADQLLVRVLGDSPREDDVVVLAAQITA